MKVIHTVNVLHMNCICFLIKYCSSYWRHQMEASSALLAICTGNSPVTGEFPAQSQWRGALICCIICARLNGWVRWGWWFEKPLRPLLRHCNGIGSNYTNRIYSYITLTLLYVPVSVYSFGIVKITACPWQNYSYNIKGLGELTRHQAMIRHKTVYNLRT